MTEEPGGRGAGAGSRKGDAAGERGSGSGDAAGERESGNTNAAGERESGSGSGSGRSRPTGEERTTEVFYCDLCGNVMLNLHCKLICERCGYRRDCSDP